jgi:hypothetical protein
MSIELEKDEIITVVEEVENGYFYLENRQFNGPFESSDLAIEAALTNCTANGAGECRAVYHGSVRVNPETSFKEPMGDMRQIEAGASLVS